MNIKVMARYPFLKEASTYLQDKRINLDAILKGKLAMEQARYLGKERVKDAIEFGIIMDKGTNSEASATAELLSYPIARILVSCLADPKFVNRYAIAEGKRVHDRLMEELNYRSNSSSVRTDEMESGLPLVLRVAADLGLIAEEDGDELAVDFTDFLRGTVAMRSKSWKLINQSLVEGKICVEQDRFIRLAEQMLTNRISSELPLPVSDEILAAFSRDIEELHQLLEERKAEHPQREFGTRSYIRFPPCMRELLDTIRSGKNAPHSGRFALVAFLHTLGMDSDDILATFSTSPDFDESKSRYQIQHISGETSGTEYTPPSCATMKTYGICVNPDEMCKRERIDHPLKYYRAKGRRFPSAK